MLEQEAVAHPQARGLGADARDGGAVHEAVVHFRTYGARLHFVYGECTCAARKNCVHVVASVLATGNTAVVVASQQRPLPAVSLTEVLATSDVPGGVLNLLTGVTSELAPWLASHRDVNALDLSGGAPADRTALEIAAADSVTRVFARDDDWAAPPGLARLRAFVETKTVWHPIGV